MKLYFTPNTCSFAPHIVLRELGLDVELHRVRLGAPPVVATTRQDYRELNPNGYVPLLQLDDGRLLSEGVAILLHLGDLAPKKRLAPPVGSRERDELHRWLTFTSSELHKMFSPWLFHPEYGEQAAQVARARIENRFAHVDAHLASHRYLLGDDFSVADAYLFTIADWSTPMKMSLDNFPALRGYLESIRSRPSVLEALGLEKTA